MRFVLPVVCSALMLLVVSGCTAKCDAKSCPNGCCDASGLCQPGTVTNACGTAGVACTTCQLGTSCSFGTCSLSASGGGTANANGGGTQNGGGSQNGGGGGTLGSGGGNATAYETFCRDYLTERCRLVTECGAKDSFGYSCSDINSYCASVAAQYPDPAKQPTIPPNCISMWHAATCFTRVDDSVCYGSSSTSAGTGAIGASCSYSFECVASAYCDSSMVCPGVCTARIGPGQVTTSSSICQQGLYAYGTTTQVCIAPVAVGLSCAPLAGTNNQSCVTNAYCSDAKICTAYPSTLIDEGQPCGPQFDFCRLGRACIGGVCSRYLANGATCTSDTACSSSKCLMVSGASAGTCQPEDQVAGGPCIYSYCAQGLYCTSNSSSTLGVCATYKTAGSACSYSQSECGPNLYCTATSSSAPGVCAAVQSAGGPCTYSGSYRQCGNNLYCTVTQVNPTGVCATPKTAGTACSYGGPAGECAYTTFCSGTFSAPVGVCATPQSIGGACVYGRTSSQCESKSYCNATSSTPNGVCVAEKPTGAACTSSSECLGYCSNMKCVGC